MKGECICGARMKMIGGRWACTKKYKTLKKYREQYEFDFKYPARTKRLGRIKLV